MKRILKLLAWIIGIALLVVIGFASFISIRGIPTYEVEEISFKVTPDEEKIARGEVLVSTLCAGCHMSLESRTLIGKEMLDAPKEFGKMYSPNITNDAEHGIGNWTDEQIVYLLRTGIKPDGSYAPPWMAKLPHLSDYDMEAIVSFLRTDHPLVAAQAVPDKPCEPSFLTKFLTNIAFFPLPYPEGPIAQPDTNDKVAWGRYLTFNFECFSCHSADFKTNDYLNPEKSEGYLGGGNKPLNLEGEVMLTQNITSHKEFGIGRMTKSEFIELLKYGKKNGEPAMRYPMLPYSSISDEEAGAIYAYLMTTPPLENDVPRSPFK